MFAKAHKAKAPIGLLSRLTRSCHRYCVKRGTGLVRSLLHVLLIGAVLLGCSGFVRGQELDAAASRLVDWLQSLAHDMLADGWVDPAIADMVVLFGSLASFAILMLVMAWCVLWIPSYIGFLILSELSRRQGRNISGLELLLGVSMPMAMTTALVAKGAVSLYACSHFILCYAYMRLSNHPKRVDNILNWYVRIRTPMEGGGSGSAEHDVDDSDDADTDDDDSGESDF
jgi:hypothetical protein